MIIRLHCLYMDLCMNSPASWLGPALVGTAYMTLTGAGADGLTVCSGESCIFLRYDSIAGMMGLTSLPFERL